MPFYCYKCLVCGEKLEDFQHRMVGTRDIPCPNGCGNLARDFMTETLCVMDDWEPGYNIGIDYHYTSKSDLLGEIKRRGLLASRHCSGVTKTKRNYYGDEEHRDMYKHSPPIEYDFSKSVEEPRE